MFEKHLAETEKAPMGNSVQGQVRCTVEIVICSRQSASDPFRVSDFYEVVSSGNVRTGKSESALRSGGVGLPGRRSA